MRGARMRHVWSRVSGGVLAALFSVVILAAVASAVSGAEAAPEPAVASQALGTLEPAVASQALGTLSANVYAQTSAEHRACCYGIFAAATWRLEEALEDAEPVPARPAVVMDLDETVLDNSSFQAFLYRNGLVYTPELWERFEREGVHEVGLVAGAELFIRKAESLGVAVVYLSNRNETNASRTVAALAHVGLDTTLIAQRLFLKPNAGSSDKSRRRDAASARYNVLMYLGDNLRDFSEVFAPDRLPHSATTDDYLRAMEARSASVDDATCHWGVDWFVLPNPMYGEWEKLVPPNPADILRPSGMEVRTGGE